MSLRRSAFAGILLVLAFLLPDNALAGIRKRKVVEPAVPTLIRYAGNVHHFAHEYPQEKVYLQFDNTSYVQGDTIWFKAYVVNATDLTRARSRVLYVELLNARGNILKSQKLRIVAGQADGCFNLNDETTSVAQTMRGVSLQPSGFYEIRAYTANMLNFQDAFVFSRVLPVFDLPENGVFNENHPTIEQYIQGSKSPRPRTKKSNAMGVSFYPEGGSLIIGKPCRVAFKVTGSNGLGMTASGTLNDSLRVRTLHDGMGSFVFTPTKKRNQMTFTHENGYSRTFSLPDAQESGCAMSIGRNGNESVNVSIMMSSDIALKTDSLGLAVMCRGEILHYSCIGINADETDFYREIPLQGFPEGVCQICLYGMDGKPVSTRMFYHNAGQTVPSIAIAFDKESYKPYDRIGLSIDLSYRGRPFRDRICLSVRDSECRKSADGNDLRTSMLLSSDLKGLVWNPSWYFESDDAEHREALDLLCMVQGWERYEWTKMAGVEEYREEHRLEDSIMLNGWALSRILNRRLDNVKMKAHLVLPDSSMWYYNCVTADKGYFGLNLPDFTGDADMIVRAIGPRLGIRDISDTKLLLERAIRPVTRSYYPIEPTLIKSSEPGESVPETNRFRPFKMLEKQETEELEEEQNNTMDVVKMPDGYLLPDVDIKDKRLYVDYATFQDFNARQDVENAMDYAKYTTDLQGYLLSVGKGSYCNSIYETKILVECDQLGPMIDFAKDPLAGDMYNIESVLIYNDKLSNDVILEIMHAPHRQNNGLKKMLISNYGPSSIHAGRDPSRPGGDTGWYYLIEVIMKKASEQRHELELLDISTRHISIGGYSTPVKYYSPQYPDGPVKGRTDRRRTLYWNPNVIADENGHARVEFYNNAYSTHFTVTGAGMTSSGLPYVLDTTF